MRQTSALDAARQLRDVPGLGFTPIVFVSASPAADIDQMQGNGIIDHLALPLDPGLLKHKVTLLLQLHRKQLEIEALRDELVFTDPWREKRSAVIEPATDGQQEIALRDRVIFEHPTILTLVLQAVRSEAGLVTDWVYVDANKNALRVLNRTLEGLVGKRLNEVIPSRAGQVAALCAQVLTTQEPVHYESHFASTDFLACLFPGGKDLIVSSGIDITERNRAAREVQQLLDAQRAEKEWLVAVLNGINEEVYFTDRQGRYTYANPAAIREFNHGSLSGIPVETVIAELIVLRADGTPRPAKEAPPLRALSGEVIRDEAQIVCIPRTGEYRHREVSSAPVRNAEGQIIGSVSVARDVTVMKEVQARLRAAVDEARLAEAESQAKLAAELVAMKRLHDISTTAMTTSDQQVLLEEILDATIALHAAKSGSVQLLDADSKTLRMSAHRGMDQETVDQFAAVDASTSSACGLALARRARVIIEDVEADPARTIDPVVARRMGVRAMQSTPLFTVNGSILGMLSTHFRSPRTFSQDELRVTDLYAHQAGITIDRKRVETALSAARESSDRANKAKSHFVRAASHDLRQSVQTLALLNSSLRASPLSARERSALQQQGEAIDTMMHLLDALLNISKLESGGVEPKISDFAVATMFEKLRMEFASLAAHKGIELRIVDATASQAIHSDPTLVGEILRNLLSNAIKFTPKGSITLRSMRVGSNVRLEVIDTGIGIPREELPLIFGEFYQVGVSATLSRQGYGLGLGIVQRMAMLLQADIQVESELGKGSTFSLTVPAGELEAEVPTPRTSQRLVSGDAMSSTILLVEDDASVRSSMELFFGSHGHRILSAESFDQTLTVVRKLPRPELLITDFHLPGGKTGSDVIASVREVLGESLPAILLSGDTSADIEDLPHDAHVRFASKPIDPDTLVALVQEMLVKKDASRVAD